MNAEHEKGIREAVTAVMSKLTHEELRELVMEPYREFTPVVALVAA